MVKVIVGHLGRRDRNKFIKMNEQRCSAQELDAFIQQKIPNARKMFADAMLDFRREYVQQ